MGRITLRLPEELHERLVRLAAKTGVSLNSEIVRRLEALDAEIADSQRQPLKISDASAVPGGAAATETETPGEAAVSGDAQAAPRPDGYPQEFVDESDFVCGHEPYKSAGGSFCYRCGSRI